MNTTAKVTIIIPCYNNASTIVQTLNSVMQQDYESIEIIIVNDGSSDNTDAVINEYMKLNKKYSIVFINQKNGGPSKARNTGADKANSPYLIFLDADDLLLPSFVSKCMVKIESDPDLNIIYTKGNYFGARSGEWNLPVFSIPVFIEANCIPVTALIRKKIFEKVGGFDEKLNYTEDWELWIKIIKEFGGVFRIDESLFLYRKRSDKSSLTDNSKNIDEKSILYIYSKHYDFFSKNNYGIKLLLNSKDSNQKFKKKYYNVWYRKIFYKLAKKK
jgi:glycosyltransferase involved in cell wall biosynthesis